MLLPRALLTDDVNAGAISASASASTSTTSTTHILLNSMLPFDSNSDTLNDDISNDDESPKHPSSIVKCQTMEEKANHELMTNIALAYIANPSNPIDCDCVRKFPCFEISDVAELKFHFPTSNSDKKITSIRTRCLLDLAAVEGTICECKKFPIFRDIPIKTCKEFPVSRHSTQYCGSSFSVEKNIFEFQTLPFFNDLNMPQATATATAAVALALPITNTMSTTSTYTPPTITISKAKSSPTKIITHATNIATEAAVVAAVIYEQMERNEHGKQFLRQLGQEAQVHNDQEQYARSTAIVVDDGIRPKKSKQPTGGEIITMNKNSKLEDGSGSVPPNEQFMIVYDDDDDDDESIYGKMDTHKIPKEQKTNVNINENENVNSAFSMPLICDDNDAFENLNIEPKLTSGREQQRPQSQPPPFAHQQNYSDVRDTSSKEVLAANKAATSGQCGTFEQPTAKATENETATTPVPTVSARQPSKSSFSLDVLTSHATVGATLPPALASVHDRLPKFELLPHYYALELVEESNKRTNWIETIATAVAVQLDKWTVDLDDKAKYSNQSNKSGVRNILCDLNALRKIEESASQSKKSKKFGSGASNFQFRRAFSEMTLTKLEEHEDGATQLSSSEPPSPVLSLGGEQLLSSATNTAFEEMKFEMRATKAVLPQPQPQPSSLREGLKHERRFSGNGQTTTMPSSSALQRLSGQQNDAKNLPTNKLERSQSSGFGQASSVDTIALLPARTHLRRQRRMASQGSVDKEEDPIVRLNRLRARISGALSEVKGVLSKYSTETEPSNEPTTTTTTTSLVQPTQPAPQPEPEPEKPKEGPITFRFVRKVRRRSVFLEEDETNEKIQEIDKQKEKAKGEDQQFAQPKTENVNKEEEKQEKSFIESETPKIGPKDHQQQQQHTIEENEKSKVRLRKKPIVNLAIEPTDNLRRASTGAIKEASVDEALELQNCKTQRRPSDSAALVKDQTRAADEKRNIFKTAKSVSKNSVELVKEKARKALDQKTATANVESSKKNQVSSEPGTHSKKRSAVKRSDSSLRRASIAAVEKSKLDEPDVSGHRRASDATAAPAEIKPTPSTAKSKLITRRPTPRVKAGAKAKRSSLILSENETSTLLAVDESSKTSINNATERNKQLNANAAAAAEKTIDETSIKVIDDVPAKTSSASALSLSSSSSSSSAPLSPAAIDRATTASIVVDTIKNSQKTATETIGQSVAITAAVPTSLAQSNEANSRIAHVSDQLSPSPSVDKFVTTKKGTASVLNSAAPSFDTDELINQKLATVENYSTTLLDNSTETKIEDIKKPIHQQRQEKIPAAPSLQLTQPSSSSSPSPSPSSLCAQQVAVSGVLGALECVLEIDSKTAASEVNCSSSESAARSAVDISNQSLATDSAATKAACLAVESNSGAQTSTTASSSTQVIRQQPSIAAADDKKSNKGMPELQILPTPVQAVPIPAENRKFAPLNLPCEKLPKKKIIIKKIVRQKSTEKHPTSISRQPSKDSKDASSQTIATATIVKNKDQIESNETDAVPTEIEVVTDADADAVPSEEAAESPLTEKQPAPAPKKQRQVKKKVIIKRQQRRLSVSDQTFYNNEINHQDQQNENDKSQTELLEKAIAYVTDDEDDVDVEEEEAAPKEELVLKGCMRRRELEVGELIMYAERYKRTQVRWKKGRVLERITSISYKLEIDGKEVPAHISYIKRYTERKVSFGGKEYLEIEYEQMPEEAERKRSYSIWNMV